MNQKKQAMIPVLFRLMKSADLNFVYNSWIKSYGQSKDIKETNKLYYLRQKMVINHLMVNSNCLIGCNPDDDSQIYNYIVYQLMGERLIVHWMCCKYPFRQLGLGKELLDMVIANTGAKEEIVLTHRGANYGELAGKFKHLYQPELAYE